MADERGAVAVGELVLTSTRHLIDDDELFVDRADPCVWICGEILDEIATLTAQGVSRWATVDGDVLTIRATNRTVVYRVDFDSYDPDNNWYLAQWPD